MDAPPVQYVTTSDGYSIAYCVSGSGVPFVYTGAQISHVQLYWTHNTFLRPWLEGLSERFQLVMFDGRGKGMSQRGIPEGYTPEDDLLDLEAVMDRLGLERAVLHGIAPSSQTGVRYAMAHPNRVAALVLHAPSPRTVRNWLLPIASADWERFLDTVIGVSAGPSPELLTSDTEKRARDRVRQTTTQADFIRREEAWAGSSIEKELARVTTPTLILSARDARGPDPEDAIKVASVIPNARLVAIDGATIIGDAEQGLKAIEDFLADLAERQPADFLTAANQLKGLSQRELEVLRLLAAGKSNQQIADDLVISLNTVRRHVSNVFDKTDVANRTEASVYARDHGIA